MKTLLLILSLAFPALAEIKLPSGVVLEDTGTGSAAMLIIPGGGYLGVTKSEGMTDLKWLTTNGVRCFTIIYRIAPYPAAFNDVGAAWEYIHTNKSLSLDRFAIIGASAGGHLEALTIGKTKFKPDTAVFIYPLVTMSLPGLINFQCLQNMAHGEPITQQLMDETSAEKFLDGSKMPPSFIAHNANDTVVNVGNSMLLANINPGGEIHLYHAEPAEHGMSNPPPWIDNCIRFLKVQKFIR